jgi:AmmeMemoRadiSam system protein B
MILRKSGLPIGWYPRSPEKITLFLDEVSQSVKGMNAPQGIAAAAPHAGWYYSGAIAAQAVASLKADARTVAVIGGHLPAGMPPLIAEEDAVETPLGNIVIDRELRDLLKKELGAAADRYQDNTVEVLLPMVRYFLPKAQLVWLRFPADMASFERGKLLAEAALSLKRELAVLGSTDLTHYGPNYGFTPHGYGQKAFEWVKTVNDRAFIRSVTGGDPQEVLLRAETDRSACSAGAVLGCMGCAAAMGAGNAELLAYGTSADGTSADAGGGEGEDVPAVPDSFVGYGAFRWR